MTRPQDVVGKENRETETKSCKLDASKSPSKRIITIPEAPHINFATQSTPKTEDAASMSDGPPDSKLHNQPNTPFLCAPIEVATNHSAFTAASSSDITLFYGIGQPRLPPSNLPLHHINVEEEMDLTRTAQSLLNVVFLASPQQRATGDLLTGVGAHFVVHVPTDDTWSLKSKHLLDRDNKHASRIQRCHPESNYTWEHPHTTFCETFSPGSEVIHARDLDSIHPGQAQLESWIANSLKDKMAFTENRERERVDWMTPRSERI